MADNADTYNSDEDKYADESFENDSDTEVGENENSESDEALSGNDEQKETVQNPIYSRNHFGGRNSFSKKDFATYSSSSEDEDDVVISHTIAEINTEPMCMEDAGTPKSSDSQKNSSSSIFNWSGTHSVLTVKEQQGSKEKSEESDADESKSEHSTDTDTDVDDAEEQEQPDAQLLQTAKTKASSETSEESEFESESEPEFLTALKSPYESEAAASTEHKTLVDKKFEAMSLQELEVDAVVTTESDILITSQMLQPGMDVEKLSDIHEVQTEAEQSSEQHAIVRYEQLVQAENYYTIEEHTTVTESETDISVDEFYRPNIEVRINSETPTSFNSDDYLFHMNLVKKAMNATSEKCRSRTTNRKSWSFSNERVREIERQNQILLRKILTQKPTYVPQKSAPKCGPFPPTNRVTSAAVNRKKQQRQIDLDNDKLKRKIEAISLRRPML